MRRIDAEQISQDVSNLPAESEFKVEVLNLFEFPEGLIEISPDEIIQGIQRGRRHIGRLGRVGGDLFSGNADIFSDILAELSDPALRMLVSPSPLEEAVFSSNRAFADASLEIQNSAYRNNGDFIVNLVCLVPQIDHEQPIKLKILKGETIERVLAGASPYLNSNPMR